MRRYVIGDIHGCSKALRCLIEEIRPGKDDMMIFLGDYIDRGPDSCGVIDQLIELSNQTRVVAIRGNHEVMLLGVLMGGLDCHWWRQTGGQSTLASYGGSLDRIPDSHLDFFHSLRCHYETEHEIFIHAGYDPLCPVERTCDLQRYWNHQTKWPAPHFTGKRVYVGHTPQASGEVLNLGHVICVDTYCFGGGWLTAMNVDSHEILQASRHGHLRRAPAVAMLKWCQGMLAAAAQRCTGSRKAEASDRSLLPASNSPKKRYGHG
jgi:serine/threonine protein phosphatase 1